jgi:hypothetical protein
MNVRVSKEKLIDLAKMETEKRAESGSILSAYIVGSVASGNPILGGTADVDLVLIHNLQPDQQQEFLPFSDDFHLDITHHSSELYDKPTELRVDPWLGPAMCEPLFLYDPLHFFERAQAGVRGRFHRADHVHERAQAFLTRARRFKSELDSDGNFVSNYLRILLEGTNAIATLAGFPAAGRRMVLILESRLEKAKGSHFFEKFLQLQGANRVIEAQAHTWLAQWDLCAQAAIDQSDRSSIARHRYYFSGFEALLSQERPEIVLWNLLDRWGESVLSHELHTADGEHQENWENALTSLGLQGGDQSGRSDELENYLDDIEDFLNIWADQHGA